MNIVYVCVCALSEVVVRGWSWMVRQLQVFLVSCMFVGPCDERETRVVVRRESERACDTQ